MVYVVRLLKFSIAAFAVIFLASCSAKQGSTSSVTIVLPSASSHKPSSQSVSALSFDFTIACFAINVTGPSVPQTTNSCLPTIGRFSGFQVPGTEVKLDVPQGSSRTLEVFLFNRALSSDPCPADFSALAPEKVTLIGSVSGIEMNQPEVTVNVTVNSPAVGENLVTQNVVPASCAATPTPTPTPAPNLGPSSASVSYGAQLQTATVGGYKADVRIKHQQGLGEVTTTGGYKAIIGPPVVE